MTETKLRIVVLEPNGTTADYTTTTRKNAHDIAQDIGKWGFFANSNTAGGFTYYPPARIVLITKQ